MQNGRVALVSEDMPDIICKYLENSGCGCVRLKKYSRLDAPVAAHPDMLFFLMPNGEVLADGEYLKENSSLLNLPIAFNESSITLGKKYPADIAFDALIFDDTLYGKLAFIAPEIRQTAKKEVDVAQGYTLCSTLVTDKCAVTADEGIFQALTENGVPILKIAPVGIELDGYSCGFIGGASVYDKKNSEVIFFGDVTKHPDCKIIVDFLQKHGHGVKFFEELPLKDYGSAKIISI